MARDEALLYSLEPLPAALRFYAWDSPTISLGCFQRFDDLSRLYPRLRSLPVVRRPTGGGAILHDREITYCLVLDDSFEPARRSPAALYRLAHECWRTAILAADAAAPPAASNHVQAPRAINSTDDARPARSPVLAPDSMPLPAPRSGPFFCFEKPGRTDLLLGDRKLLGSAQRRIPGRVLQHGSLLLQQRFPDHPGIALEIDSPAAIDALRTDFARLLAASLNLTPRDTTWSPDLLSSAQARRAQFASADWTRRR